MIDYDIIYEDESFRDRAPEDFVRHVITRLAPSILGDGSFSLSFVSPGTIQEANRTWRGIDSPTDILSFALEDEGDGEDPFIMDPDEGRQLGDILVCLDAMDENAALYAASSREELLRLLIHGMLHLSGEDHETNDFATEPMLVRQETLLQENKDLL